MKNSVIYGPSLLSPIPNQSLGRLIHRRLVASPGTNVVIADAANDQCLTIKDLLTKSCCLADRLKQCGYGKRSIFAIISENSIEYFTPVLAGLYLGATVATINPNFTANEMLHALDIAKPEIIFVSEAVQLKLVELRQQLPYVQKIIVIDSGNAELTLDSIKSMITKYPYSDRFCYEFHTADVDIDNDVAFILYSSGTTGLSKGVMITHRNMITKLFQSSDPRYARLGYPGDNILGVLPFFHTYGLSMGLITIYNYMKLIVMKNFELNLYLKTIEKYKIRTLTLVPPLAVVLAKHPAVDRYNLSSVTDISCGAAPLDKKIEQMLKHRLKIKTIRQGYGLTECTLSVTVMPRNQEKPGSCGKLVAEISCKIRNPITGDSLGPGEIGEICIKGPLVMKGYWNNEEATRNSFTADGWLLTGDLGFYDKDEYFYIVGRLKELIKYKGFQVAPAELEAILLTNPKIQDVAVIGSPDQDAGELPLAFVVKYPNENLSEEEVHNFLNDKVSAYKKLRGGVVFINEIPKNPSGKILRKNLHEMLTKLKSKL